MQCRWIETAHFRPMCETRLQPKLRDVSAVIENRVVEIEENSLW